MALVPGKRLGHYEVVAPLGAGGMGEVYRARDTTLGRDVALKVLPLHAGRETPRSEWVAITDGKQLDREPKWSPDGNLCSSWPTEHIWSTGE